LLISIIFFNIYYNHRKSNKKFQKILIKNLKAFIKINLTFLKSLRRPWLLREDDPVRGAHATRGHIRQPEQPILRVGPESGAIHVQSPQFSKLDAKK
jgi:hypothetical protein